jgi:hypothetical protein
MYCVRTCSCQLKALDQVLPAGSSVVVVGGPDRVPAGRNARFEAWAGPVDLALEEALAGAGGADRAIVAGSDDADSDAAVLVATRRLMQARAAAAADGDVKDLHVVVAVQRPAAAAAVRETLRQGGVTGDVVLAEDLECGALAQVPRRARRPYVGAGEARTPVTWSGRGGRRLVRGGEGGGAGRGGAGGRGEGRGGEGMRRGGAGRGGAGGRGEMRGGGHAPLCALETYWWGCCRPEPVAVWAATLFPARRVLGCGGRA